MCCHGERIMELIDFHIVPISELKKQQQTFNVEEA